MRVFKLLIPALLLFILSFPALAQNATSLNGIPVTTEIQTPVVLNPSGPFVTTGQNGANAGPTISLNPYLSGAEKAPYPVGLPNAPYGAFVTAPSNTIPQPFFVNFYTEAENAHGANSQATTLRVWSAGNLDGSADNGLEGFYANTSLFHPTAVNSGDKLLKLAGFGYATNGYAINDAAVVNLNACQNFSDTNPIQWPYLGGTMTAPDPVHTQAGGTVSIETSQLDQNNQQIRAIFDCLGNVLIGRTLWTRDGKQASGVYMPSQGALWLQDSPSPPSSGVSGAGALLSASGFPQWRAPSEAANDNIPLVDSSVPSTSSDPACFDGSNHKLINCAGGGGGGGTSAAKAMVRWDGTSCSPNCTIVNSNNVASVVRNGTGDYTINFTSGTYSSANDIFPMFWGQGRSSYAGITSSSVRVQTFDASGSMTDFGVEFGTFF